MAVCTVIGLSFFCSYLVHMIYFDYRGTKFPLPFHSHYFLFMNASIIVIPTPISTIFFKMLVAISIACSHSICLPPFFTCMSILYTILFILSTVIINFFYFFDIIIEYQKGEFICIVFFMRRKKEVVGNLNQYNVQIIHHLHLLQLFPLHRSRDFFNIK